MSSLRLRGCVAALTCFALQGCFGNDEQPDPPWSYVTYAAECGYSFKPTLKIESDDGKLEAALDCVDKKACERRDALAIGTQLSVAFDASNLVPESFETKKDPVIQADGFTVYRDPCTEALFAEGTWTVGAAGEASLRVVSGAGPQRKSDTFTWQALAPTSLELEVSKDGETWRRASDMALSVDDTLQVRMRVLSNDEVLIAQRIGRFWIEDEALVTLQDEGIPFSEGVTTALHARVPGETVLHALVSNIELSVPVKITK